MMTRPTLCRPLATMTGWMRATIAGAVIVAALSGCSVSDILHVAPPSGVQTGASLQNKSGAEAVLLGAKVNFFNAIDAQYQLIHLTGVLSDEFNGADVFPSGGRLGNIDARRTAATTDYGETGDTPLSTIMASRSTLLLAAQSLQMYEPADSQFVAAEALALAGYIELMVAEDYCAGATLDRSLPGQGIVFGEALTTDSLLGVAEAHFDSALTIAHGNARITALASMGLGRARLNRGHYADAASAVSAVPVTFVYNSERPTQDNSQDGLEGNLYQLVYYSGCARLTVANRKGGTGLDFVSANDPRLILDSTSKRTCDHLNYPTSGTPAFYTPTKFGTASTTIPIASGIEARLIQAEAALNAHDASWLTQLNALRTTCTTTVGCPTPAPAGTGGVAGLPPLDDPGTDAGRVDLVFRERAFWLFGTGMRLGDLRRLIRQYNRASSAVFPGGAYMNGLIPALPTFGTDVSLTLPTPLSGTSSPNPHYKGCLTSPATA